MFNKRGQLGASTIILLVLGAIVLVGLVWGSSLQTNLFNAHNSEPNVNSIVSKCKTECGLGQKFNYCSAPKKLISATEILTDTTCIKLAQEKPEYGIEYCDKINCGEETGEFTENPAEPGKPEVVNPVSTELVIPEKCKEYSKFINQYASTTDGTKEASIKIDPALLFAVMAHESSDCTRLEGSDGGSTGLMQVFVGERDGKKIIPCIEYQTMINDLSTQSIESCKAYLLKHSDINIRIATTMLRNKYSQFGTLKDGKEYDGCFTKETYKGWYAALRGYNGWYTYSDQDRTEGKCTQATDNYVNAVLNKCYTINNNQPCLKADGTFVNLLYN